MTAIGGLISLGKSVPAADHCRRMLDAQRQYGPHQFAMRSYEGAALGRCLYRLLPEDGFDQQPSETRDGRFAIVADIRIDNREELLEELGVAGSGSAKLSDSAILTRAFEQWREKVVDHLIGDFAFAVWDKFNRSLLLVRDALGLRPLHYHYGIGWAAFSSMPRGLLAHPDVSKQTNSEVLAEFVADLPRKGSATFFRDIQRVEPGHILSIDSRGVRASAWWAPQRRNLGTRDPAQLVEAFREQLDRATRARMRGSGGVIASHLSSGWDSGAVTATAARLEPGGRLLAFTAAPAKGFNGPTPRGLLADEGSVAAQAASCHSNIEHVVMRPAGMAPLSLLSAHDELVGQPTGYPCNNAWWSSINSEAAANGATIVLTGEMGNLTINAGGVLQLADMLRQGKFISWCREAGALVAKGPVRWTGVLDNSFGAFVPFYGVIRPYLRDGAASMPKASLVASHRRFQIDRELRARGRSAVPPGDSFQHRLALLRESDSGNFRKGALAQWGIDERDPTADRRLIEFCLSMPTEALLKGGVGRPIARAALSDRLPSAVLDLKERGYQMADWFEQIKAEDAEAVLDDGGAEAADVINLTAASRMIYSWPTKGWASPKVIADYRMGLMRAVAAASFIKSSSRAVAE